MSYVKQYFIYCDGPLCVGEGAALTGEGTTPLADQRDKLRRWDGWKTGQPGGKDYCAWCAKELGLGR